MMILDSGLLLRAALYIAYAVHTVAVNIKSCRLCDISNIPMTSDHYSDPPRGM